MSTCALFDEPYCAGRVDCLAMAEAADEVRRCGECEWAAMAAVDDRRCMVHGHRFAVYKCDSCCSVAVWCCDGHHYCERCHTIPCDDKHFPCPGPDRCPLGIPHPRNTDGNINNTKSTPSFVLGCSACLGHGSEDDAQEDLGGPDGYDFGYPERNWEDIKSGKELLDLAGEREVRDRLHVVRPGLFRGACAEECAERLLLHRHIAQTPEALLQLVNGDVAVVKARLLSVGMQCDGHPLECAQRLMFLKDDAPLESIQLWDARRALQPAGSSRRRKNRRKHFNQKSPEPLVPVGGYDGDTAWQAAQKHSDDGDDAEQGVQKHRVVNGAVRVVVVVGAVMAGLAFSLVCSPDWGTSTS